jgi:ABC-type dipeptide/oligopeptide/nickel transport system permease subunit
MSKQSKNKLTQEHFVAPYDDSVSFDELPDAPPRSKFRFSFTGWLGLIIVCFWVTVAITGPFIAPYGENDLPFQMLIVSFRCRNPVHGLARM